VERGQLDLHGSSAPTTQEIEAGVDGESVEPGVEPIRITKSGEIAPGPDQPLLDRVACELRVAEDEAGRLVQPHDSPSGELGEGVVIALPCLLDEPSLVHGRLGCGTTTAVALDSLWRRRRGFGSWTRRQAVIPRDDVTC
jgi:hypothetical protein